ncbi:MAG: NTPase [Nitrospirae bacterium]|nr:NTPase [Nitrospirota bacterium]
MAKPIRNILITGKPGIGKTTLIRTLVSRLTRFNPRGFYTEEIRKDGKRRGFVIRRLDGTEGGILAHVDIKGSCRVGKYGVNLEGFESFLSDMEKDLFKGSIILIDEIGKMECFSGRFIRIVERCLSSEIPFVATVSEKGGGFIEQTKRRGDVTLVTLTIENRDSMPERIIRLIKDIISVQNA